MLLAESSVWVLVPVEQIFVNGAIADVPLPAVTLQTV